MAKKIYLADDEQDIREILTEFLSNAGYEVTAYKNGDTLFSVFQEKPCDLVILDIMMPGSDGLSICKKLRTISSVPIIILTAKDSESDHMKGFMYGGDDYLIKPFSPSLLVVRVNALFRRVEMNIPVKADISFGDVCFSWEKHNAIVKEHDIGLTMTEFSLLGCLMEHGGTAIPRNEILDKVWGIDSTEIETRVVDETVRRVRQKMKTAGSKVRISAVWGYGYKLEDCNETRYKIATLTGSAVMAAMLLSLLILNIVFNKKIELRAENAIKNVFTLNSDEYLNYESENDTGSLYYASLVYMGADSENRDDIYQILTPKEKKLIDWYETHPSDEMQRAKINEATYYMEARTEYYEDSNERLLAYVDVTGEPELVKEISFGVLLDAFVIAALGAAIGYFLGKKLEQNDKAQKTFFENTSHELKTPLMAICGYAEEIEMGVITDYSQAGRMIVSQTERMSKLIEDILYLSKMESGTEPLKCEPIEMASLVQDILMPLEGIVNRRNLSVSLELDEGYVNGDPEKLEHAVANLITNSVKYACSQIEISWKNQVLSIWNDGGELSTEDFSHMFERFHTGQNGNSGIGLALSKEIVEMHGWKLSAKNDRHGICLSMVCHS